MFIPFIALQQIILESAALFHLPFRLFCSQKCLQNGNQLLQGGKPNLQFSSNLLLIVSQLGVKILSVGGSGHGSAENRLHQEAVVGFEGAAIGVTERGGEFFGGFCNVLRDCNRCEVKASMRIKRVS